MTNEQRERIATMRQDGCGYTTIAKVVGLTKDSVKAYCRAHNLAGMKAQSNARIAARLYVSPNTVKTQLRSLYRKLGAAS